jgi:hypothetical protein
MFEANLVTYEVKEFRLVVHQHVTYNRVDFRLNPARCGISTVYSVFAISTERLDLLSIVEKHAV